MGSFRAIGMEALEKRRLLTVSFTPQPEVAVGADPDGIAVADVNGDGKADLIVCDTAQYKISVCFGNGNGTFAPQQTYETDNGPTSVVVADVNNDGHPDLLIGCTGSSAVDIMLNNGNGTFGPPTPLDVYSGK